MSSTELSQIPELAKNLARVKRVEDRWREFAFLPETDRINGVEVRQLTLGHLMELERVKSPFLTRGIGTQPEDVGLFLWIVSPHYDRFNHELRCEFLKQLMAEYPPERFRMFYRAIHRWLWTKSLMDIPAAPTSGITVGTSTAAALIHLIASAYGWAPEVIKRERMAALYQYIKWINLDPHRPQFNPLQDRVTAYYGDR
jgi:hypothetical protein